MVYDCINGGTYVFFKKKTQLGPFVDSNHPEIEKGAVDATFSEIFQVEVIRRVLIIKLKVIFNTD